MRNESLVFLDTNVCIDRTIANIKEPKIYSEKLNKLKTKINDITNTNLKCKLIISDIVYSELKNEKILTSQVIYFCENVLKYRKNSFKTSRILNATKKSISKCCDKYYIKPEISELIRNSKTNLPNVDKFYLQFSNKLKEITDKKISRLFGWKKERKIQKRPNNMPEESDRLLLCQAIELDKNSENDVGILSNDSDFTEFGSDILKTFNVEIEDSFS